MDWKKIRINDLTSLNILDNYWIEGSLESLDNRLLGIVPKMFYHYEITDTQNTFIVVPVGFENKVQKIVNRTLVSSISLNCLSLRKEDRERWNQELKKR